MAIVKKLSIDDPHGASEVRDIGADAVNVDYDEENSVKDKIDDITESLSNLSSTVANKLDTEGGSLAATVAGSVTTQTSSSDVSDVDTAALIWGKFNALRKEFGDHANSPLYTETGIHGIRYYGGVLQVWDSTTEMWDDVSGGAEYPAGGATGQALIKASGDDNDVTWGDTLLKNGSVAADYLTVGSRKANSSIGINSFTEGGNLTASGNYSHAEGRHSTATGPQSHAEGISTTASGSDTHAEGAYTRAQGDYSHAEGYETVAGYPYQHVSGKNNNNKNDTLFEIGNGVDNIEPSNAFEVTNDGYIRTHNNSAKIAFGVDANNKYGYIKDGESSVTPFGEGDMLKSTYDPNGDGIIPIANGGTGATTAANARTNLGLGSLATKSTASLTSDVSGILPIANGGTGNSAGYIRTGLASGTTAGNQATAEGSNTTASGDYSHAEGQNAIASGQRSHAEGGGTKARAYDSHAEGYGTIADGSGSHAEGNLTTAYGEHSHAEGHSYSVGSLTNGIYAGSIGSHAEGCVASSTSFIRATGKGAHAEGYAETANKGNLASGIGSHAEGIDTTASGNSSHAEGFSTTASGDTSHAENNSTTASGNNSHAEGYYTTANNNNHAQGHYNKAMNAGKFQGTTGDAMAIGNGSLSALSNAFRVTYAGAVYGLSAFNSSGADYAEFFEWKDENKENEDRVGLFVTLDGDKIKLANTGDYILGIISGQPSVIGNGDEDWLGRWQRDDFGRFVWGEVEIEDPITKEKVKTRTILPNPKYDPEQKYVERKDRPEWDYVGMLGALAVRDNGKCKVNGFCRCGDGGIAVPAESGYRVIKRVSDNVIKVIFK